MPRSTLEPLAGRFRGKLIRPDDADYDEARTVFNAMIDKHPSLIAQCETVDDVVRAVQFGRDHDLEIAVRGGGHSVAGKGGERLSTTWPTPRSSLDLLHLPHHASHLGSCGHRLELRGTVRTAPA